MRVARRTLVAVVVGAAAVSTMAPPAEAKGASMYPILDTYEPGNTVTLIGYTTGGRVGDVEGEGPFQAYLLMNEDLSAKPVIEAPLNDADDVALGPVEVTDTVAWGLPAVRGSVTFALPADLTPGTYNVLTCGRGCTSTGPGDLFGGFVDVGVDSPEVYERMWPSTEPAIAQLHDDVRLVDLEGDYTTAAHVRGERSVPDDAAYDFDADGVDRSPSRSPGHASDRGAAHEPDAATTAADDRGSSTAMTVVWLAGGLAVLGAAALWTWRRRGGRVAVDDGGGGGDDGGPVRAHRL